MLKYNFYKQVGDCICSIDNMVLYFFSFRHDDILKYIHENFYCDSSSYYENLDKKPSSKYHYWRDNIHCGNLYVKLGKYKYNSDSKKYDSCDIISFEINPNKHFESTEYRIMEDIIDLYCDGGGWIHQVDFAIDIPCSYVDLILFPDSRKEPGLYKGTRYFGSHNQNGFVKAYDKTKESRLQELLSRVEITFIPTQDNFPCLPYGDIKDPFKIISFGVVDSNYQVELKGQMKSLALAVQMLEAAGLSSDPVLSPLGYRQRVKIREAASGGVKIIDIPEHVVRDLIVSVAEQYNIMAYMPPDPNYFYKKSSDLYFSDLVADDELPF